jgi:hypothetical protein
MKCQGIADLNIRLLQFIMPDLMPGSILHREHCLFSNPHLIIPILQCMQGHGGLFSNTKMHHLRN